MKRRAILPGRYPENPEWNVGPKIRLRDSVHVLAHPESNKPFGAYAHASVQNDNPVIVIAKLQLRVKREEGILSGPEWAPVLRRAYAPPLLRAPWEAHADRPRAL